MKPSEVIAIVVAFLGLAGAFQSFVAVDLYTKLITIGISEGIVLWIASRRLAEWARSKKSKGFGTQPRKRPWRKPIAGVALAIIAVVFSIGEWGTIRIYAINIETHKEGDKLLMWVFAPTQLVNELTIDVPLRSQGNCRPEGYPSNPANSEMVDWDSGNPMLRITDFHNQRQEFSCNSVVSIDQFHFHPKPESIEVFKPERRRSFVRSISVFGGVTWLLSVVLVFLRSS